MKNKYKKMPTEEKIRALSELWVKWNLGKISGNKFAYEFSKAFEKETMEAWKNLKHVVASSEKEGEE